MGKADWFGGRLRELREAAGLTQAALAERAGLARGGVAQLEAGKRKPAWETVVAIIEALDVLPEAFLTPPASDVPSGRGRPPKPKPEATAPKRPRGRPRKSG
jgi:transcriptional regulator with XRE-family HTH domain